MKTRNILTPTAELLVVELPRVCDFDLYQNKIYIYDHEAKEGKSIDGSYTLLGKVDEIKDEDAAKLFYNPIDITDLAHYANLRNLFSLIESEIYWVNPYGDSIPIFFEASPAAFKFFEREKQKWQEAEQKTFDKNRTLVFKKNK